MRFQKSAVALFVGALVLAPATGAFAEELPVEAQSAVVAEAPAPQVVAEQDPAVDAPAPTVPAAEQTDPAQTSGETSVPAASDAKSPAPTPAETQKSSIQAQASVTGQVTIVDSKTQAEKVSAPVGTVLEANVMLNAPSTISVKTTYVWSVNGVALPASALDAQGRYTVPATAAGKTISVKATATWPGTAEYAAGTSAVQSQVTVPAPAPAPKKTQPTVTATAKIEGSVQVRKTLTAKTVDLKAPAGLARQAGVYTWYADGKQVGVGKTYLVKGTDFKKRITVSAKVVWAESDKFLAGSFTTKPSAATAPVVKQTAKVSTSMKVSGLVTPGATVKAVGSVQKPSDLSVSTSYTWYVGGVRYGGGQSLTVQPWMVGRQVAVEYRVKWGSWKYVSGSSSKKNSYTAWSDTPGKMVRSAQAQLGAYQDCTALIERALRFAGKNAGDLGTRTSEYTALGGTRVGSPVPGDVLIWEGRHVAMYIGNGKAIHSGYAGNQTVVAGAYIEGTPSAIVRYK